MTSIAAKLEANSLAREKTVTIVIRLMSIGAGLSAVALFSLLRDLF